MISIKEAEEILKKEYHIDNFLYVVNDLLLPDFKFEEHDVAFNNKVFSSVKHLGESSKCEVNVYEVILNEGAQNRRVTITQEMFRILRGLGVNNAIVAFSNADRLNYRFSLLTSKYEFDGEKVVKVLSNPRRYSYSLGYGTKTKTAYDFLIGKGKVNSLDELINRFSVEVVNKQFYNEIALAFTKLVGGQREGKTFEKELNLYGVTDQNKYAEFAVRLIGRIVFCWFLKEKKSENGIPLIPESMLSLDSVKASRNYYHDTLEPLFFELLNTNQLRRKGKFAKEEVYTQIPYLNGGLFNPHADDHYKFSPELQTGQYGVVTLPNGWFEHFYEILGQYNFTVDENTSYDIELSIDPEMLGRIFENLLAEINPETGENAKKSTGSFYTPRDIVDYMVDSSILEHLKTKTGIDEAKLRALISYGKEDDELATFSMPEKKALINALYTVTVLDPACGSGAFPIGMLQKIVYMLQELDPGANLWFDKATENVSFLIKKEFEKKFNAGSLDYIRKLTVIQNSIFGVDIQPIAVEIARLRCFLSLVIEEKVYDNELNRGINPLPNLDFKFIIANTLVTLPHDSDSNKEVSDTQLSLFERQDHISQLKAVREEYFSANDLESKNELKLAFSEIQKEMFQEALDNHKIASARYQALFQWKPFSNELTNWFDSEWMFGVKDGFDIVIGNPPYISAPTQIANEILKKQREYLVDCKRYRTLCSKWDLFIPFLEIGLMFLKNHGILTMIVPYPLTNQIYAKEIRKLFTTENDLIEVVDLKDVKVFEATVQNCIPFVVKGRTSDNTIISKMVDGVISKSFTQPHTTLIQDQKSQVWNLTQQNRTSNRYKDYPVLGDYCYLSYGLRPNSDEKTSKGEFVKKDLISTFKDNVPRVSYIEAKDIDKYSIKRVRYLEYGTERAPSKFARPTFSELYICPKLMFNVLGDLKGAYDKEGIYYHNHSLIACVLWKDLKDVNNASITGSVKKFSRYDRFEMEKKSKEISLLYILGIMNSKYASVLLADQRSGDYHIYPEHLRNIPIPLVSTETQEKVSNVVEELLQLPAESVLFGERLSDLNKIVYQLYGLTEQEIAVVEETIH